MSSHLTAGIYNLVMNLSSYQLWPCLVGMPNHMEVVVLWKGLSFLYCEDRIPTGELGHPSSPVSREIMTKPKLETHGEAMGCRIP